MAEFRNDRLICKHFGLSYIELRDDISQAEYICLLAEALDADELADYNTAVLTTIAFNSPKSVKRWKWQSPDKAGTAPAINAGSPAQTIANVAALYGGNQKSGSGLTFAKATGRPFAFRMQDGSLMDEDGQTVEQTREMIIVPWTQKEV